MGLKSLNISYCAYFTQYRHFSAEHRRFCWDQPEGARHGCRASAGGHEALSTAPQQNRGAQE